MTPSTTSLLTDLYELTMTQAYLAHNMTGEAVFEFFVRKLPTRRNFFMAAGLEQGLSDLPDLRNRIEQLRTQARFFADDRSSRPSPSVTVTICVPSRRS